MIAYNLLRVLLTAGLTLAALLLLVSVTLVFFALENTPRHVPLTDISSAQAKQASQFLARVSKEVINARGGVTLRASENELNSALLLAHHTNANIAGRVAIFEAHADFALSLGLHALGLPYYLNTEAKLLPSTHGFKWTRGKIGRLNLSDGIANFLFNHSVQSIVGKRYGRDLLAGIKNVNVQRRQVSVAFHPPKNFQHGIADAAKRLSHYTGQEIDFDSARVQHHLDALVTLTRSLPQEKISISYYLHKLFAEAQRQSGRPELSPERENLFALYALAVLVAPGTFRHFVADLQLARLNATTLPPLTLAGREDLAKHFIFSAALTMLAEQGLSFSLGETKEIIDAHTGGSGFSFADITADRAGIHFVKNATQSPELAQRIQNFCAQQLSEEDFFPPLNGLPEGLDESAFKARFTRLHSVEYKRVIADIDRRLQATRLLAPTFKATQNP